MATEDNKVHNASRFDAILLFDKRKIVPTHLIGLKAVF